MLKDLNLTHQTLVDFIKQQLILHRKEGVAIHLDGSLQSIVNIHIAKALGAPFTFKVIVCTFAENHQYLKHITSAIQDLDIIYSVYDLQHDYQALSKYLYARDDIKLEIAHKKCLVDFALNLESAKFNLMPLSNLCYSQWVLDFPHPIYKNLAYIHPLARFFQSEVVQLAKHYSVAQFLIDRKPSFYLYRGQQDEVQLDFTYSELEDLIRRSTISSFQDDKIQAMLVPEDREKYLIPAIQRPSNLLG